VHELRRVLGLFVVFRKYIRDYALITKPLTALLRGKPTVFTWGKTQQQAFEIIRDKLLQGVHLASPDFSLPFHLPLMPVRMVRVGNCANCQAFPLPNNTPTALRLTLLTTMLWCSFCRRLFLTRNASNPRSIWRATLIYGAPTSANITL
jgi:hypothetical protein